MRFPPASLRLCVCRPGEEGLDAACTRYVVGLSHCETRVSCSSCLQVRARATGYLGEAVWLGHGARNLNDRKLLSAGAFSDPVVRPGRVKAFRGGVARPDGNTEETL